MLRSACGGIENKGHDRVYSWALSSRGLSTKKLYGIYTQSCLAGKY